MELPENFQERMRALLGEEYPEYRESLKRESLQGIRVNTGKISVREFQERSPFSLRPVPWTENGFYVNSKERAASHPYYYAGLYYVQEPSAMLPAALLYVKPGERVLDLCAAPGGKATELGARLRGEGFLLANDISHSRAKALLKNLELHGVGNVMVTSEDPQKLARLYEDFFDKVLVDAPCSGEGMFRKDASMIRAYRENGPEHYAKLQAQIADAAVRMLRPGGRMVYSTCTFSAAENEDILLGILDKYPQMHLVPSSCPGAVSLADKLPGCLRLYPHRVQGEGHFAALLEKSGIPPRREEKMSGDAGRGRADLTAWRAFSREHLRMNFPEDALFSLEDSLFALPVQAKRLLQVRYLRTGLYLGESKKHGFEPSQALAMHLRMEDVTSAVSFSADDGRVARYLKGETVELIGGEAASLASWVLVCVDGYPLGWAKWVNGSLRNKYHTAWRMS